MSDRYSRAFAAYAEAVGWEDLPGETIHEVKRRILDSVGVATAAFDADAPSAARAYARGLPDPAGAVVWGTPMRANPEIAGFANGVAVRYLDFNDTYLSKEPLHPSDVIAGLVALAEWCGAPPRELIAAIAVAYELPIVLCDAASLRAHRWDHVNYLGIGAAAGAAKLLGLPADRIEHAIAIGIVPHAAMRQTRAGELSMWKGAAAANSTRNAVFAALLASKGMTGPFRPFEGEMGFVRQLLGGEGFDDAPLGPVFAKEPPRRILDTYLKFWPVEYHAQSAVDAALKVRARLGGNPDAIRHVRIQTFEASYQIIAKDPEKWAPKTRETADHSLQYIVVAALEDGEVTRGTFDLERIRRPETLVTLRERVGLEEDPELTAGYPEGIPNRVTVTTTGGETVVEEVRYPRGHARNPMTDEEVERKFRDNVEGRWRPERTEAVLGAVWSLEEQPGVDSVTALLADGEEPS